MGKTFSEVYYRRFDDVCKIIMPKQFVKEMGNPEKLYLYKGKDYFRLDVMPAGTRGTEIAVDPQTNMIHIPRATLELLRLGPEKLAEITFISGVITIRPIWKGEFQKQFVILEGKSKKEIQNFMGELDSLETDLIEEQGWVRAMRGLCSMALELRQKRSRQGATNAFVDRIFPPADAALLDQIERGEGTPELAIKYAQKRADNEKKKDGVEE